MPKTIVTVAGIRPDFIRLSHLIKILDANPKFKHILVDSGQHYNSALKDVFFSGFELRKPDVNLRVGGPDREHFHQSSDLSVRLIEWLRTEKINPDIILFLGDSNSVLSAIPLKKEGYKIGHIEAGMRSYDPFMIEEINRVAIDHVSSLHFVYHKNNLVNLIKENINPDGIHVVGNTIVEVCFPYLKDITSTPRAKNYILVDIHRHENLTNRERMKEVISMISLMSAAYQTPIRWVGFPRTLRKIEEWGFNLGGFEVVPLMGYLDYLNAQYQSRFIISDSGTAQEEPALLGIPVVVPRSSTERPESMQHNCSRMIDVLNYKHNDFAETYKWLDAQEDGKIKPDPSWLGSGMSSHKICGILEDVL
jgi:UDP-N-acetylglucosamine 2-epimerase